MRNAEGGRRKAEGGRRKAEGGRRKAEGGRRNAEYGMRNAECVVYIDMYVFLTGSSGVGEAILDFIEWFHSTDFGKRYVRYTYSLCR